MPKSRESQVAKQGEESLTNMSVEENKNEETKGEERKTNLRKRTRSLNAGMNSQENDFLMSLVTNEMYEMKFFSELEERLNFIKYILKNSDSVIKPVHLRIFQECLVENSFH